MKEMTAEAAPPKPSVRVNFVYQKCIGKPPRKIILQASPHPKTRQF